MCKILEDMCMEARMEGRAEGIMEGEQKTQKEFILRMLNSGRYSLNEIAEVANLSVAEVKQFQTERGR